MDELVDALRNCADYSDCGICKLNGKSNCADIMMRDAADAIERLTDKNGKKIFEGDIVQYPIYQGKHRETDIHTVVFERRLGSAYFGITMDDIETWYFCCSVPSKLMEVIGNIHDKKEAAE